MKIEIVASSLLSLALLVVSPGSAGAALISCTGPNSSLAIAYDVSARVTPNIGCGIEHPFTFPGQTPTEGFVNAQDYFGGGWTDAGKFEIDEQSNGGVFATFTNADGQSGTFTLDGPALMIAGIQELMFVFKSGAGTSFVAYLIDATIPGGIYGSPYVAPLFRARGEPKDVSHIAMFARGGVAVVPEPGAFLLLMSGLAGFGLSRRRGS